MSVADNLRRIRDEVADAAADESRLAMTDSNRGDTTLPTAGGPDTVGRRQHQPRSHESTATGCAARAAFHGEVYR